MNIALKIREITNLCHSLATKSGWWNDVDINNPYIFATKLCLVHSELSEAMEGHRKNLMDDHLPHRSMVEVELADVLIRVFDLAGAMNLDLGGAMQEKLEYNQNRPDHKPENRAKAQGKTY